MKQNSSNASFPKLRTMTQPPKGSPAGSSPEQATDKTKKQNIKSLELVRWIETQPSLAYLREIAGGTPAQHDSLTGQFSVRSLDPTIIRKKHSGTIETIKELALPSARSMRGNTYSSPRFESSCSTTAYVMAASTAWDAVSTVPFIQFGLQGLMGGACRTQRMGDVYRVNGGKQPSWQAGMQ